VRSFVQHISEEPQRAVREFPVSVGMGRCIVTVVEFRRGKATDIYARIAVVSDHDGTVDDALRSVSALWKPSEKDGNLVTMHELNYAVSARAGEKTKDAPWRRWLDAVRSYWLMARLPSKP
jgi:hypothetical protein